jgi:D-aminopeptidase
MSVAAVGGAILPTYGQTYYTQQPIAQANISNVPVAFKGMPQYQGPLPDPSQLNNPPSTSPYSAIAGNQPNRSLNANNQYTYPTTIHVGALPTGPIDGITDVPGVLVNHVTKIQGSDIRDGATVVMPNSDPWYNKVEAASYTINGNGALTNHDWVDECGRLEDPVVLVGNTLDVGRAYDGEIEFMMAQHPQIGLAQDVPLAVVGEIDGQRLNNAPVRAVSAADVAGLIARAPAGQFARGSVGAGTPSVSFQYKAGIGSSSRVLPQSMGGYTVGVLVNANTDVRDHLTMDGVPVGTYLPHNDLPQADPARFRDRGRAADGSIIIVVATDAPLDALQLKALAKRTAEGLYRTGAISRLSSGDQVIAFSTSRITKLDPSDGSLHPNNLPKLTDENTLNMLYAATGDATESAIDNSLLASGNRQYHGNGALVYGIPVGLLLALLSNPPGAAFTSSTIYAPPKGQPLTQNQASLMAQSPYAMQTAAPAA